MGFTDPIGFRIRSGSADSAYAKGDREGAPARGGVDSKTNALTIISTLYRLTFKFLFFFQEKEKPLSPGGTDPDLASFR